MKIGVALPHVATEINPTSPTVVASPVTITQIAQEAERNDFASLWTLDRLFYPRQFVAYGNNTYGIPVPDEQRSTFDAIETLTYAATKTEHILLGTSVIDVFFQAPVVLARRLATLDHFSAGRLIAGVVRGWMKEEFEATGIPIERASTGFGDYIKALQACWGPDPVRYQGRFYSIAESYVDPKPIQAGGPPLLLGSTAPATIKLAARIANGINPMFLDWGTAETTMHDFFEQVRLNGRDPSQMQVIARINNGISAQPLPEPRMPLMGSYEQIREDLQRIKEIGVQHVLFDLAGKGLSITEQLRQMEQLRRAADI